MTMTITKLLVSNFKAKTINQMYPVENGHICNQLTETSFICAVRCLCLCLCHLLYQCCEVSLFQLYMGLFELDFQSQDTILFWSLIKVFVYGFKINRLNQFSFIYFIRLN